MNNKQLAEKILELVGGKQNVSSVKIIGTNLVGTQFQIILGAKVADVYNEFEPMAGGGTPNGKADKDKKISSRIIDTFTGIFTPILPAIIGAGLLKGVLSFLMFFGLAPTDSDLYQLLNVFSDAVYYFLPMLLAVSTATHFKCNKYVAMAVAGVLLHPNLIAMMGGDAALHFFGLPITKASYSSTVLPVILSIWLMSYVEKILAKVIPNILRTILVPLFTVLIVAPITLIIIGQREKNAVFC